MKTGRSGFTLIELMIVVVIIGILAALAVPRFTRVADEAKQREADTILKQILVYQLAYVEGKGSYATTTAELSSVGWAIPNLKYYSVPVDITLPVCMTKTSGGSYPNRQIDANGTITNC